MKKLVMAIVMVLLFSASAMAAPFLICTPYAKNGTEPTNFVVNLNGTSYMAAPTDYPADTTKNYLHFDLAGKTTASNSVTVKAQNIWGDAALSSPFVFNAGAPAQAGGIGLSAN